MDTIFYISVGALACLGVLFLLKKNKANKLGIRGWSFSILSLLLVFFGLAWAQISIHENEMQAAVVGLLLFGGTGIVFGLLSLKHLNIKWPASLSKKEGNKAFSFKSLAIGTLIVVSSVLLFFSLFLNKAGTVLSSEETMSEFITEQVIADDVLPQTIKKAIVYQILYDSDELLLEQRIIIGILGSVDEQEWIQLFDMIVPEAARAELVKNATSAIHRWIESDQAYPQLEITPQKYTAEIKRNAEEILLWLYEATMFPPCADSTLQKYDNGIYSTNLQDLISCKPPHEYREQLAQNASVLFEAQIDSAGVPASVKLEDKIAETMTAEQMTAQKKEVRKVFPALRLLFIVPLILLLIGIALLVFMKLPFVKSIAWPATISGLIGLIFINYFSNTQHVFNGLVDKIAEAAPAPALAIIQNLMTGIIEKTLPTITIVTYILLVGGIVLLFVANAGRLKGIFVKG